MEDRQTNKIKKYFENVRDEGEDVSQTIQQIINTAGLQVQALLNTQATILQKEAVINYLTKITTLFTELNHSGLKFLESEPLPVTSTTEHVQNSKESQIQAQSPSTVQDLNDYCKVNVDINISMCDFSSDGPKILNNQVVNDSCISKPLDNTILKAICSNLITHSTNPDSRLGGEGDLQVPKANNSTLPPNSAANNIIEAVGSNNIKEHSAITSNVAQVSPPFSSLEESETFSTVSSVAYQHPLAKFKPPIEIPKQYDTQNLEQIRENLIYLSKKMGFDSDSFSQMKNQFNKDVPSFEYEEPVKEKSEVKGTLKEEIEVYQENRTEPSNMEEVTIPDSTVTDQNESKLPVKLTHNLEIAETAVPIMILNNNLADTGPSSSTGAVRKQQLPIVENLIEFSDPNESDSEICEKVTCWLSNNRLFEQKLLDTSETISTDYKTIENSAIEKLHCITRHDRNAEEREQAIRDMPDLRLVPVEVPRVIRNDLNSDSSCSEKRSIGKKKQSKDLNKENAVYEIKKMETPEAEDICIFSHVESPNEFYLQILDSTRSEYLDEISEKLNSKFRKTETPFNTKLEAFNKLGKFCCGYILDDKAAWYRLQVLDWQLGSSLPDVIIKCIDYGFKCRTSYQYLREMTKDLSHIPMLAVQCHFPLLYPPSSTYSDRLTEWPQVTVESLCDMVSLNHGSNLSDVKMFIITLAELEGDSLAVDLVPFAEQNPDSLRNLLLDSGLAVDISEDYGEHPELGEFLEDIETLEKPANLNELVLGYDAKDEMRICRFTRSDGTCYKGKNCKLEHIPLKDGYTTDQVTAYNRAINDLIFPVKGEIVRVLVTAYIDSCTYLVQLIRNPVEKENTNIVMNRDMSDLFDAMNHPKKIAKYEPFKVYPSLGEIILAYYALSQIWVRVAVRKLVCDKDGNLLNLEVYAVDFGDRFTTKLKDTRVMIEDFMRVPFQVIQIYLGNYRHKMGCDAKKAKRFFEKYISYKNFLAHVESNEAPFKVRLTTFKGSDIGPTLRQMGHAENRKIDVQVSEGGKMDLE